MSTPEGEDTPSAAPKAETVEDSTTEAAEGVEKIQLNENDDAKQETPDKPKPSPSSPTNTVSGQVAAREGVTVKGLPSEASLSEDVRQMPPPLPSHAYLCDATTDILPCLVEGQVIQLFLPFHGFHSPLLAAPAALIPPYRKHKRDNDTPILVADNLLYAGGAYMAGRPAKQPCWALKDKKDEPVVLCMRANDKKHSNRERVYNLYGRAPLYDEDEELREKEAKEKVDKAEADTTNMAETEAKEEELKDEEDDKAEAKNDTEDNDKKGTDKQDDTTPQEPKSQVVYEGEIPFYPWYQVRSYSKGNFDYRFVSVWNFDHQRYDPVLKFRAATPTSHTGPILETTKRLLGTTPATEAVVLTTIVSDDKHSDTTDEEAMCVIQRIQEKEKDGWQATVAPGMDPALAICAAVVVADFPEFFCHERNPYASKMS